MGRPPSARSDWVLAAAPFRFLPDEVEQMEARLQPLRNPSPDRVAMEELARKFSASAERIGKVVIQPKQVRNWFCNRRYYSREGKAARAAQAAQGDLAARRVEAYRQQLAAGSSAAVPAGSSSGKISMEGSQIKYEAKSDRDGSWYDVDVISFRTSELGELEAIVQLSGFGAEEAGWVNARTCLRQRSVPFRATECELVRCWDFVLCYKESEQGGLYFDARVHGRKIHDSRECDCKFLVRYEHDQSEPDPLSNNPLLDSDSS
ncbi:protein SAWADEE HOMEODOMAIN HOMOLOG 2-like [Panicum virgatum]|uniref:protein SAWADEE HOMEODOMAIN HOMOLOG 2-like n=1 Tax=Panicum virgatum TaxID=38727 RepID=UPI0019D67943|nr:protein SAWADEE HOMEODOMAIN HOMOLOG 2-like [Panicum virgatum]